MNCRKRRRIEAEREALKQAMADGVAEFERAVQAGKSPMDTQADGPWQIGDWVWCAVCWVALLACIAALLYTMFDDGKPVY